jgi:Uma2 family endonuclease
MAAEPTRRQFTVREYYRMAKAGILTDDDRVELVEGEIIQMPPIGGPHASRVDRIAQLFFVAIGIAAQIRVQNPLRLSDRSEPVPDVMLLVPKADFYASGHPMPGDVLLLIEVSDTTLGYDLRTKVPLYARNAIPEAWVLDLGGDVLRMHREPSPAGYKVVFTRGRGERIAPLAFPELDLAVDDILG